MSTFVLLRNFHWPLSISRSHTSFLFSPSGMRFVARLLSSSDFMSPLLGVLLILKSHELLKVMSSVICPFDLLPLTVEMFVKAFYRFD